MLVDKSACNRSMRVGVFSIVNEKASPWRDESAGITKKKMALRKKNIPRWVVEFPWRSNPDVNYSKGWTRWVGDKHRQFSRFQPRRKIAPRKSNSCMKRCAQYISIDDISWSWVLCLMVCLSCRPSFQVWIFWPSDGSMMTSFERLMTSPWVNIFEIYDMCPV